jgi:hypothetical protein
MRRAIYVSLLTILWIGGVLLVIFWIDNFLRGDGRAPLLVVAGGWLAATAAVALAEEVAELARCRAAYHSPKRTPSQGILVIVTGNFLHEHHDPVPQGGIINSHEHSDQL